MLSKDKPKFLNQKKAQKRHVCARSVAVPKRLKGAHWKCARRDNIRARVRISPVTPIKYCGVVAAVARRSHKPKVGGAIPSPATIVDVVQWPERQPSKLSMWVRFPSSTPYLSPYPSMAEGTPLLREQAGRPVREFESLRRRQHHLHIFHGEVAKWSTAADCNSAP